MKFDIRVTPYQVEDEERPYIMRDEKIFTHTLKGLLGTDQVRRQLFSKDEKSISGHFKVLDTFEKCPLL